VEAAASGQSSAPLSTSNSNNAPGPPVFIAANDNETHNLADDYSMAHAQEIESIHEEEIDVLLVSNATPVVPLYQQTRVWVFVILICGVGVLLGNLLGSSSNSNAMETVMPPSSIMPSSAPSASPTSNEDLQRKAFVEFYDVLAGDNWIENKGWGSTGSNMCVWPGIVCGTDGEDDFVEELRLPANNLTGNVDNIMLDNFRYLERLDLDSNSITGNLTAFSRTLASFPNLTHVDLRLNKLTGSVPTEVCKSIENGILRVDCGIECDCCNHEELCGDWCVDVPRWHDSDGSTYSCDWYVAVLLTSIAIFIMS